MITVYLHIGTHKTGTTAIQIFLASNQDKLLDQGILYPLSGKPIVCPHGQHNLARAITQNEIYQPTIGQWKKIDKEWDNLHEEIQKSGVKKVVISTECFCFVDANSVKLVKKHLEKYNTKIIVYVRRQDSFFESLYCTEVSSGRVWSNFQKFFLEHENRGDYYQFLLPWVESFGKENLILKVYEEEKLKKSLINSFLETIDLAHLDLEQLQFQQPRKANVSPDKKVIKVMRVLNVLAGKIMSIPSYDCRDLYLTSLGKTNNVFNKIIRKLPSWLTSEHLLSLETKINLLKEFENSNQKVALEYLGRQDGKLFDPSFPDHNSSKMS